MGPRTRTLLVAAALVGAVSAQATYVVDISGGAGSHFRKIQSALDAAADGDTILIRPGDYPESQITTGKGVRIVADAGARVYAGATGTLFTVSGVPAGKRFVLKGLAFFAANFKVAGNPGEVVLDQVTLPVTSNGYYSTLLIQDCRQVVARGVYVRGIAAVRCSRSRVVFAGCDLGGLGWSWATAGIKIDSSDVSIINSWVFGGGGAFSGVGPGIDMTGGSLVLTGPTTQIVAGLASVPVPAVMAQGGTIDLDPAVTLVPQNGAGQISGGTVRRGPVPSCIVDRVVFGSTTTITLYAPQGSAFCIFVGAPIIARASPFGTLWLDPARSAVLACQTLTGPNVFSISFPVTTTLPPGITFAVQAGVLSANGPTASEPGFAVAR